jgi:hypothetical protein
MLNNVFIYAEQLLRSWDHLRSVNLSAILTTGTRPFPPVLESVSKLNISILIERYLSVRSDNKAQKNGAHRSVYWVKKKEK